jgi:hypothetical protein
MDDDPTWWLAAVGPVTLVKLLTPSLRHHSVTYVLGRNDDLLPWNPEPCEPGGLHCCEAQWALMWLPLYKDPLLAIVTIPSDARVARFDHKIKASSLVIEYVFDPRDVSLWGVRLFQCANPETRHWAIDVSLCEWVVDTRSAAVMAAYRNWIMRHCPGAWSWVHDILSSLFRRGPTLSRVTGERLNGTGASLK